MGLDFLRREAGVGGQVEDGADEIHLRRQGHVDVVNGRGVVAARDGVGEGALEVAEGEVHRTRARGHRDVLDAAGVAGELHDGELGGALALDGDADGDGAAGHGLDVAGFDLERGAVERGDFRKGLEEARGGVGELVLLEKVEADADGDGRAGEAEAQQGRTQVRRLMKLEALQRRMIFAEHGLAVVAACRAGVARELQAVDQLIGGAGGLLLDGQRHLILREPDGSPAPPDPADEAGHDEDEHGAGRHAAPAREVQQDVQGEHDPQIRQRRGDEHGEEFEDDQAFPVAGVALDEALQFEEQVGGRLRRWGRGGRGLRGAGVLVVGHACRLFQGAKSGSLTEWARGGFIAGAGPQGNFGRGIWGRGMEAKEWRQRNGGGGMESRLFIPLPPFLCQVSLRGDFQQWGARFCATSSNTFKSTVIFIGACVRGAADVPAGCRCPPGRSRGCCRPGPLTRPARRPVRAPGLQAHSNRRR